MKLFKRPQVRFAWPRVEWEAVLVLLLSVFSLGPLLHPGYFWGAHDARHSVYFLFEFHRVFSDGIWYPRWMPDFTFGYGYPFFNIYSPGVYFLGEFLHLAGLDLVSCVKVLFGAGLLLSGLAMYGFVRSVFGSPRAGLLSGLAYVYMPYHLLDVYVRANLAESAALVWMPLTLWAAHRVITRPRVPSFAASALAYAGLVFTHNGVALLFSPVLAAWMAFLILQEHGQGTSLWARLVTWIRAGLVPGASIVLGLGLVAIFFIPLVFEFRDVNVAQWNASYYSYAEHFVSPYQLFSPTWGFGISVAGPDDGLSFQLGLTPLALGLLALPQLTGRRSRNGGYLWFFWGVTCVVVPLMLEVSRPLWDLLPLVSVAQFPWRLLGLTTVSLAVLAGSIFSSTDIGPEAGANETFPALILAVLVLTASYPYVTAQNLPAPPEGPVGLAALMNFQRSANEMTGITRWVKEQPRWSPLADLYVAGRRVNSKVDFSLQPEWLYIGRTQNGFRANSERIGYNSPQDAEIVFNVSYYPGWRAYLLKPRSDERIRELVLGQEMEILDPHAQIKVKVPAGEYFVLLTFEDTPPRTAGKIVSGLSLALLLGLLAWDAAAGRRAQVSR